MTSADRARGWLTRVVARYVPPAIARAACAALEMGGWRYSPVGERDRCPACGAMDVEPLLPLPLHDRDHHTRVGFVTGCRRCGIAFANPMPSADALGRMYSPEGRWGRTHERDEREQRPSLRYLASLLEPVRATLDVRHPPTDSAVLDFGCGAGEWLDALQDAGWITYGIEPAEKGAFARHHELTTIPTDGRLRLALAHHVLEHVPAPFDILRALHASLAPGGLLVVSVPRLDTLRRHRDFRYCINDRAHVISYTRDAMATLLVMAGFAPLDVNPPDDEANDRRALKRLRMLGHKGGDVALPADPLRAARDAFAAWAQSQPGVMPAPRLSVRGNAALLNLARLRK